MFSIKTILTCLALGLFFQAAQAQQALEPRKSPIGISTCKFEDNYVKITYGRPHKNGRVVFGNLIPYGKIWRLGSNEATEITFQKKVKINGKTIKPGTYAMFAIPNEKSWTLIFNTDQGQWGSYKHDETKDVLKVEVPVQENTVVYEPLTFELKLEKNIVSMNILWDKTKVVLPIEL